MRTCKLPYHVGLYAGAAVPDPLRGCRSRGRRLPFKSALLVGALVLALGSCLSEPWYDFFEGLGREPRHGHHCERCHEPHECKR